MKTGKNNTAKLIFSFFRLQCFHVQCTKERYKILMNYWMTPAAIHGLLDYWMTPMNDIYNYPSRSRLQKARSSIINSHFLTAKYLTTHSDKRILVAECPNRGPPPPPLRMDSAKTCPLVFQPFSDTFHGHKRWEIKPSKGSICKFRSPSDHNFFDPPQ